MEKAKYLQICKMKTIKLWWPHTPLPGNFGDILSPVMLKKLGYNISTANRNTSGKFMAIGSTAKFIRKGDTVWGTGIMRDSDSIERDANYLAVRGPLTGDKVECNVYGDPGLLCSYFWKVSKGGEHKGETGVIPHYIDYMKFNIGDLDQINILNADPMVIINEINKYNNIISSSLHGIIVAHSYGIPAGWWQPSTRLSGDGSKFKDYAESVGIELIPCKDYKKVKFVLPKEERINEIQRGLLNALQDY